MTLTELRYLVALARERHFGHAAQVCNVSQPTLSAAIKKLEEQLGMPLFERRPREVVVTPQAEPIIAQAQRVLEQADLLEQMAMSQRDQLGSPLRVGAALGAALPRAAPGSVLAVSRKDWEFTFAVVSSTLNQLVPLMLREAAFVNDFFSYQCGAGTGEDFEITEVSAEAVL